MVANKQEDLSLCPVKLQKVEVLSQACGEVPRLRRTVPQSLPLPFLQSAPMPRTAWHIHKANNIYRGRSPRTTLLFSFFRVQCQISRSFKMSKTSMKKQAMNSNPQNQPAAFSSRRSVVHSINGMVACTQPLAAEAGHRILRQGGNAAVSLSQLPSARG